MLGVSCGLWDLGCILQDLSLQCLGSGVVACGLSFPMPCGILGSSGGSSGKESICNARDLGLIPGLGRSPGGGNSYPLWYSGLENSLDCIVHGVAKSRT